MKIAIISDFVDPNNWGGAAKVAAEEAIALRESNHDVMLIAASGSGESIPSVRHVSWVPGNGISGLWLLQKHIRAEIGRFQPTIAILHQPLSGCLVQFAFPQLRTRYVFHSSWADEVKSLGGSAGLGARRWLEHAVLRRAEKIFVTSRFTQAVLAGKYPKELDKTVINPLGVQSAKYMAESSVRDDLRARHGIPVDHQMICAFRRLIPRTGVVLLIEALVDCPRITALIGGCGPQADELKALASRLGLAGRVRFLGYVADDRKVEILQAADASVVPTVEMEGFGLATLEAMACGCPAVATPVGNNADLIQACDGGVIATEPTAAGIAQGIRECLGRNWDRIGLSVRARERFTWRKHTERLLQ